MCILFILHLSNETNLYNIPLKHLMKKTHLTFFISFALSNSYDDINKRCPFSSLIKIQIRCRLNAENYMPLRMKINMRDYTCLYFLSGQFGECIHNFLLIFFGMFKICISRSVIMCFKCLVNNFIYFIKIAFGYN